MSSTATTTIHNQSITTQSSHPPIQPLPFTANQPPTIRLYPLSNYTFGTKETQPEEDPSVIARLKRLEEHYEKHGMRRTCEGILICHEHNHPHVLMLQIANAFFKLPGDYLPHDADEVEGFKSRLNERLAPTSPKEGDLDWEIGDCLAQWWRPNHETFLYPFLPAHCTRPKELKKLYLIHLPPTKILSVPKNMKLLAVPLFELYDNTARYGPQLSAIPHYLSRYRFEFVDEKGKLSRVVPGGGGLLGGGGGIRCLTPPLSETSAAGGGGDGDGGSTGTGAVGGGNGDNNGMATEGNGMAGGGDGQQDEDDDEYWGPGNGEDLDDGQGDIGMNDVDGSGGDEKKGGHESH